MRTIIILVLLLSVQLLRAQYIGVRAKYTETRLVPNPGHADSREDRLILSFYNISDDGATWTPATLSNYDVYLIEDAVQVTGIGGVLDSLGSNYPGYAFTAPVIASYFNSKGREYFECTTYGGHHYVVNGSSVDCGFLRVSQWVTNYLDQEEEQFSTINVGLAFYAYPHPYWTTPGNLNFGPQGYVPFPPYNWYGYMCGQFNEYVMRGAMPSDSIPNLTTLPVRFANVSLGLNQNKTELKWSNLTELDIDHYEVERSTDAQQFQTAAIVFPLRNDGTRADYQFRDPLPAHTTYYYRIRAIENNGHTIYSSVRSIRRDNDKKTSLIVYPNPVTGQSIALSAHGIPDGVYQVSLNDITGHTQWTNQQSVNSGELSSRITLPVLRCGLYQLSLRSSKHRFSTTIIVE